MVDDATAGAAAAEDNWVADGGAACGVEADAAAEDDGFDIAAVVDGDGVEAEDAVADGGDGVLILCAIVLTCAICAGVNGEPPGCGADEDVDAACGLTGACWMTVVEGDDEDEGDAAACGAGGVAVTAACDA